MAMIDNSGALRAQALGLGLVAFSFRTDGSNSPDALIDPGSCVTSVVEAAGVYTVTLASGYRPTSIAAAFVDHEGAAADIPAVQQKYVMDIDSYSAANGTFDINCLTDDGDGTGTVEPGTDNTLVSVLIVGVFDSTAAA
jgi:hypothetical protein